MKQHIGVAVLAFAWLSCHPDSAVIKPVSNRADLVSGGDALVEIVMPQGASATGLKVDVGGRAAPVSNPL